MDSATNKAAEETGSALPEHISQNIADIVELQRQDTATLTAAQLRLERMGRFFAQPGYLAGLFALTTLWVLVNLALLHWRHRVLDAPPFPWLVGVLSLVGLVTTTVVLIAQRRQIQLSEQRAHLDLQINLLTEQKVTRIIHLLEELRHDLPIANRHDPQTAALKQATDPAQLLSELQRRDLGPASPPSAGDPEVPEETP